MTQTSDNPQPGTNANPTPPNGTAPGWQPYPAQVPPQYWAAPPQGWNGQPPVGMPQQPYPYPVAQPYPYPVPPARATTNGTAVFAFVMSMLWIFGIGSLLGLIFGIIGAKECDRTGEAGHGLATAAAILGLLGLFVGLLALA